MRLVSYGGGEDDDEVDVTKSDAEQEEKEGSEREGDADAASEREDDVVSMDLGRTGFNTSRKIIWDNFEQHKFWQILTPFSGCVYRQPYTL